MKKNMIPIPIPSHLNNKDRGGSHEGRPEGAHDGRRGACAGADFRGRRGGSAGSGGGDGGDGGGGEGPEERQHEVSAELHEGGTVADGPSRGDVQIDEWRHRALRLTTDGRHRSADRVVMWIAELDSKGLDHFVSRTTRASGPGAPRRGQSARKQHAPIPAARR